MAIAPEVPVRRLTLGDLESIIERALEEARARGATQAEAAVSQDSGLSVGVRLGDLKESLPDYAIAAIREALPAFGRQIRGFDRPDAVLTGIETRTSSPIRITRDPETLQSLNVRGLYPAGEGAGYAGGILSAGVDGIKVAEAVAKSILSEAGAATEAGARAAAQPNTHSGAP